jgi:Smg protein
MLNRLMDLVVLVAELRQKKHKSRKDLDKELSHLGYSTEEIEHAISWMSTRSQPFERPGLNRVSRDAYRILSPWETMSLDGEAYGYLLRLQNLGIMEDEQFERIMARIAPFGAGLIELEDLKSLVGGVIFNVDDFDDEMFQIPDDEMPLT